MTPSQQQAKDAQDAARREQQADERVRELEEEIEQLRIENRHLKATLRKLYGKMDSNGAAEGWWTDEVLRRKVKETISNALDGGGGNDA